MTAREALCASARDLQMRAAEHMRLLDEVTGKGGDAAALDACRIHDCAHKRELKQILSDAISVLEDTRKAFKSKQIEDLRKKMIQALTEM
ncbi:MAG: hypothetical protein LBT74_03215 [Acidobacteriota bacterium]|jgi:hypothetical protein|nr:hypothetical protein [Acidobacteriota bacterium]